MAEISRFYGLILYILMEKGMRHHSPHVHVHYAGEAASFDLAGKVLARSKRFPRQARKLAALWIRAHSHEIRDAWLTLQQGKKPAKIEPLR